MSEFMSADYVLIRKDSDEAILEYLMQTYNTHLEICDFYLFCVD